ncbi:MAG: hypothetical protein Q7W13_07555 [Bacteroidia bacterium]|nr:hypothetical protein [Bacteroidia bacterium]
MKKNSIFLIVTMLLSFSCAKDKGNPDYEGYPKNVGEIIVNKCSVSGCHNSVSSDACAGLDLSSWEAMFKGSKNNSSVIPYRSDHSFLLFSVNTFSDFGPQMYPRMPLNKAPLSRIEVSVIKDWINQGAPSNQGGIKFSDNTKRKIYVANQGCDFVSVFDGETKLISRAFDVGNSTNTEAPHDMMVSPDGQYIYVSFYASNLFQKFRTSDHVKVGELILPDISWHTIDISGDSKIAVTTHLDANGKMAIIDLVNMSIIVTYQGGGLFIYPHGCALNYDGSMVYTTSQQGNFIYKVNLADPQSPDISQVALQTGDAPTPNGVYKPYDVDYFPDYSKYAVTCQGTNELRIFNASNDSLLSVISTTGVPQLMAFSEKLPYLFVTCMGDSANSQATSSVDVINYNTFQKIKSVFTGHEPRGISIDEEGHCVWVANRNISPTGWAPHHTTVCQGKSGNVTIIDMNTLQLIPDWKTEVSVDPYCISIKK